MSHVCTLCPPEKAVAFFNSNNLQLHHAVAHHATCQTCYASFERYVDLQAHRKAFKHDCLKCGMCDSICEDVSSLRQHKKKVHNIGILTEAMAREDLHRWLKQRSQAHNSSDKPQVKGILRKPSDKPCQSGRVTKNKSKAKKKSVAFSVGPDVDKVRIIESKESFPKHLIPKYPMMEVIPPREYVEMRLLAKTLFVSPAAEAANKAVSEMDLGEGPREPFVITPSKTRSRLLVVTAQVVEEEQMHD